MAAKVERYEAMEAAASGSSVPKVGQVREGLDKPNRVCQDKEYPIHPTISVAAEYIPRDLHPYQMNRSPPPPPPAPALVPAVSVHMQYAYHDVRDPFHPSNRLQEYPPQPPRQQQYPPNHYDPYPDRHRYFG
ncbi:hypothetical protein HDU98_001120 [Podochytrium sp. JEL0797]|nr:hypothetical protein HDU98_001120 [Podochytrium sp. JEL0797]